MTTAKSGPRKSMTASAQLVEDDVEAPPKPQQRLNVNINTITAEALQEYKANKRVSLTETVRRLIGIGHFIWKSQMEGKEILLRKGDTTERVIFDF